MDAKQIDSALKAIREGNKVIQHTRIIDEHISDLRRHAQFDKTLQPGVRSILHKDANRIENDLYHALNSFISDGRNRFGDYVSGNP